MNCSTRYPPSECCGSEIANEGAYCDNGWPAPCVPFKPRNPSEWTDAQVIPAPKEQHCILTTAEGIFEEQMLAITMPINEAYAKENGYQFRVLNDDETHDMWGKGARLKFILDAFKHNDDCLWILW
jgi:hypothetical protein